MSDLFERGEMLGKVWQRPGNQGRIRLEAPDHAVFIRFKVACGEVNNEAEGTLSAAPLRLIENGQGP